MRLARPTPVVGWGLAVLACVPIDPVPRAPDPAASAPARPVAPASGVAPATPASAAPAPQSGDGAGDLFAASVQPTLATRCAPCHIPGGKMYERLPFDDREVVRSHSEGILKRLKGDDRVAFERWLDPATK